MPDEPDQSGVQGSPTKEELECRKLAAELAALTAPWWKKPSAITGILPVVVALATLGVGFYTGFFDTQREMLELKTLELQRSRQALKDSVQRQRDTVRLEREIVRKELALLDSVRKASQDSARAEVARLNARLATERYKADSAIAELKESVATQRRAVVAEGLRTEFETNLDAVASQLYNACGGHSGSSQYGVCSPENGAVRSMLSTYGSSSVDSSQRPAFDSAVLKEMLPYKDPAVRGHLLYLAYQITREGKWRDSLFSMARRVMSDESVDIPGFWNIFGDGRWSGRDLEGLIEVMREGKISQDAVGRVLKSFRGSIPWDSTTRFRNKENVLAAIRLARDLALDTGQPMSPRENALRALFFFEPQAYMVTAATVLTDSGTTPGIHSAMQQDVERRRENAQAAAFFGRYGFPPRGSGGWSEWLKQHQDLVDVWMDPHLARIGKP